MDKQDDDKKFKYEFLLHKKRFLQINVQIIHQNKLLLHEFNRFVTLL